MQLFSLILIILMPTVWQLYKLYQKRSFREIYVFLGFMAVAAYYSIGSMLDLYVPNPTSGLRIVFEPVHQWIFNLLSL